jgi:hypothetical protein
MFGGGRGRIMPLQNSDFLTEILQLTGKTAANCPQLWASIGGRPRSARGRLEIGMREISQ